MADEGKDDIEEYPENESEIDYREVLRLFVDAETIDDASIMLEQSRSYTLFKYLREKELVFTVRDLVKLSEVLVKKNDFDELLEEIEGIVSVRKLMLGQIRGILFVPARDKDLVIDHIQSFSEVRRIKPKVIRSTEKLNAIARNPTLILDAINEADIEQHEKDKIFEILSSLKTDVEEILEFGGIYSSSVSRVQSFKDISHYDLEPIEGQPHILIHKKSGAIFHDELKEASDTTHELYADSDNFFKAFESERQEELLEDFGVLRNRISIYYLRGGSLETKMRADIQSLYEYFTSGHTTKIFEMINLIQNIRDNLHDKFDYFNNHNFKKALRSKYIEVLLDAGYSIHDRSGRNVIGNYANLCYWEYKDSLINKLLAEYQIKWQKEG